MDMMEILYKRFTELNVAVDSQSGEDKLHTLTVMAELGGAVIPDKDIIVKIAKLDTKKDGVSQKKG